MRHLHKPSRRDLLVMAGAVAAGLNPAATSAQTIGRTPTIFSIIRRCLRETRMHAQTHRLHAPKPTPGAICTVSLRGREPSRTPKKSPRRPRRRTRSASTHTFGRSSARSSHRATAREASSTFTASSAFGLPA
jgi:hypothetical protein